MNINDHIVNRVPVKSRVGLIHVTLIRMGYLTALGQFMLGATLGHNMKFLDAMLATCLGSFILEFVSFGLAYAGMKEGLSTSLLSRWSGFGRSGSAIVGLIMTISLLGWFGIQNSILSEGFSYASNHELNSTLITALSGLLLTFLVALGFRALSWVALISVPLFFIVMSWIFFLLMKNSDVQHLLTIVPKGIGITISQGATIVAGSCIAGALTAPDIGRYCKNGKHVFWMITLSIIVGQFVINSISVLVAHTLDTSDVVTIMTHSAGWIGLLSVILSAIKVNDVNLYSSSLGLSNALQIFTNKKFDYFKLTICIGLAGTVLSMLGILNHFVDFLSMLGVIFPPIAGVMLVDYYILKTSRKILDETREQGLLPDDSQTPLIGWSAIIACVVGTLVGIFFKFGIPSLNSILAAGVAYWVLMKIKPLCPNLKIENINNPQ